jgi:hypothetical protein
VKLFVVPTGENLDLEKAIISRLEEANFDIVQPSSRLKKLAKSKNYSKWKSLLEEHGLIDQIRGSDGLLVINLNRNDTLDGWIFGILTAAHLNDQELFFLGRLPNDLPIAIPPQNIFSSVDELTRHLKIRRPNLSHGT